MKIRRRRLRDSLHTMQHEPVSIPFALLDDILRALVIAQAEQHRLTEEDGRNGPGACDAGVTSNGDRCASRALSWRAIRFRTSELNPVIESGTDASDIPQASMFVDTDIGSGSVRAPVAPHNMRLLRPRRCKSGAWHDGARSLVVYSMPRRALGEASIGTVTSKNGVTIEKILPDTLERAANVQRRSSDSGLHQKSPRRSLAGSLAAPPNSVTLPSPGTRKCVVPRPRSGFRTRERSVWTSARSWCAG